MGLKYEIEELRRHASIQGYVITELTDIYWESNGLMDMERNLRVFHEPFAHVNADLVIIPSFERWAYWQGEKLALKPLVATGGATIAPGATLDWELQPLGIRGSVPVSPAAPGTVAPIEGIDVTVPELAEAVAAKLCFTLKDGRGNVIARNYEAISLYPRLAAPEDITAGIWTDDAGLAERLRVLGFQLSEGKDSADLVLARAMTTEDVEAVRSGKRYLVICEEGESRWLRADQPTSILPVQYYMHEAYPGIFAQNREHGILRSDWITAFSWLRRSGVFANIPGEPMFDMSFERVVPHHVLVGMKPWEFEAHVHSGLVVGWGHKASALICERWFGRGKAVMTTFRLSTDAPGVDPVATMLLSNLVRQALTN
jgi:hypothetical protein